MDIGTVATITGVDMFGLLGRTYHPGPEDEGLQVEVLGIAETIPAEVAGLDEPIVVYKCMTFGDEPRFLDLADYELQVQP